MKLITDWSLCISKENIIEETSIQDGLFFEKYEQMRYWSPRYLGTSSPSKLKPIY